MTEYVKRTLYGHEREIDLTLDPFNGLSLGSYPLNDDGERQKSCYQAVSLEEGAVLDLLGVLVERFHPLEVAQIRERLASALMHEADRWEMSSLVSDLSRLCHFVLTGQPEKEADRG